MTLEDFLKKTKELCDGATDGPWIEREDFDYYQGGTYLGVNPYSYKGGVKVEGNDCFETDVCRIESGDNDLKFIAHSRQAVPILLEMVELLCVQEIMYKDDVLKELNQIIQKHRGEL